VGGTPSPILNQCLEEAVERLLHLTRLMADTGQVVDGIGEAAHAIDQAAASPDATGVHEAIVAAASAADQVRERLDVEEDASNSSLADLGGQASETAAAIESVLSGVRRHAGQLAELRGRLLSNVDAVLGSSREGFAELAQAVTAYQAGVEAALTKADELMQGLQAAVNDAHDRLQRRRDTWSVALEALSAGALETTSGVAAGVLETSAVLGREVVELANDAIDHHNTAVLALRRGFTDDDPSTAGGPDHWMETWATPLAGVVEEANLAGQALESVASEQVRELTQLDLACVRAAQRIADLVARVAPALP
jgi:hypothetical protein